MMVRMDSQPEKMEACLGKTEATDLEANSEEKGTVTEQQEVPKEEGAVKTIRALKEWYGDWHLGVGCNQQLQKWTQGNGGSQKKFTTTRRGMTCHAGVAQHKVCSLTGPTVEQRQRKNQTKDSVARGTQKGQMFRK
jgi:hypothetical protein